MYQTIDQNRSSLNMRTLILKLHFDIRVLLYVVADQPSFLLYSTSRIRPKNYHNFCPSGFKPSSDFLTLFLCTKILFGSLIWFRTPFAFIEDILMRCITVSSFGVFDLLVLFSWIVFRSHFVSNFSESFLGFFLVLILVWHFSIVNFMVA